MQIQLGQDSTSFSVPFIQDTQVVTIDSSNFKRSIRDSLKQKKKAIEGNKFSSIGLNKDY